MKRQEAMSIKELLDEVLKVQHLNEKLNETRLISSWAQTVGPTLARYTTQIYISRRVLYVYLSSAIARNELSMCRTLLIKQLNGGVKANVIDQIIFK